MSLIDLHTIPQTRSEQHSRWLVYVEESAGSGEWKLDPRLYPIEIVEERGYPSVARLVVDLTPGGVENRATISLVEAWLAYDKNLGIAIQYAGMESTPPTRGSKKGKPFWRFIGQSDSPQPFFTREREGVELVCFGRSKMADEVVIPVHGRRVASPGSGALERSVFVSSMPTIFNAGGRPNRSAVFLTRRNDNLFDKTDDDASQPDTIEVPLFVSDDEKDAEFWTYLQALRYLTYFHSAFGQIIDFDSHYEDFSDAEIIANPLNTGKFTEGSELIERLQQRVKPSPGAVQGLGWITALRHLLAGTGISISEEIADIHEEDIEKLRSKLVLWAPDTRTSHWLPSSRTEEDTTKETWQENQVMNAKFFFDRSHTFTRLLALGEPKHYEQTLELQPCWSAAVAELADTGDEAAQAAALSAADTAIYTTLEKTSDDPTLWTSDAWLSKMHPKGATFAANREPGRLWGLNEDGRLAADPTRRIERYVFGAQAMLADGKTPSPGWPDIGNLTKTNCSSNVSGDEITDDDGDGWEDARDGDTGRFDPGGSNDAFAVQSVVGNVMQLSAPVASGQTGKTVVLFRPSGAYVAVRPRRFMPCVTTDSTGHRYIPFVEFSFDSGAAWETAESLALSIENLDENCCILIKSPKSLHETVSSQIRYTAVTLPGGYTAPTQQDYLSVLAAYLIGSLRVRVTSSIESDEIVRADTAEAQAPSTRDRWRTLEGINEWSYWNRSRANSRFIGVYPGTREVDDSQRCRHAAQRILQEEGVMAFSGSFTVPFVDVRFRVGESIHGILGMGAAPVNGRNQAVSFRMVRAGSVRYPTIHSIHTKCESAETTIDLEDMRLGGGGG